MGHAIDFPQRNDFIGKPRTMTDNQCYGLPVSRIATYVPGPTDKDKAVITHAHISCWELSDEEREQVAKTGKVYLKVLGISTYPVSVHGKLPIYIDESDISDHVFTEEEIGKMKNPKE
jgi:hypothetical protein